MSNGVLSLDDLQSSSNDDQGTETETDSGSDALAGVCEKLGANLEHARAYVTEHGNQSELVEFAQRLASDNDLWALQEEYRQMNDIHRIIRNYLRNDDRSFTTFTSQFYGSSDDPEPGTYNDVQQRSHEADGNLMFYRALFPEPQTGFWDEQPVLWHEFDTIGYGDETQDSHIYVSRSFVDEYSSYTIEVDGEQKPCPPSNDDLSSGTTGSSSAGDLLVDPSDHTIDELESQLQQHLDAGIVDPAPFRRVLEAEKAGKGRKGAKEVVRDAMDEAESRGSSDDSSTESVDDVSITPEQVMELREDGWDKDEIIEVFG